MPAARLQGHSGARLGRPRHALASSAPMHQTSPEVFLLARPSIDLDGMRGYLRDVGGESWLERRLGEVDGRDPTAAS